MDPAQTKINILTDLGTFIYLFSWVDPSQSRFSPHNDIWPNSLTRPHSVPEFPETWIPGGRGGNSPPRRPSVPKLVSRNWGCLFTPYHLHPWPPASRRSGLKGAVTDDGRNGRRPSSANTILLFKNVYFIPFSMRSMQNRSKFIQLFNDLLTFWIRRIWNFRISRGAGISWSS